MALFGRKILKTFSSYQLQLCIPCCQGLKYADCIPQRGLRTPL